VRKTPLILTFATLSLLAACAPRGEKLVERAEASMARGDYRAAMIDLRNYVAKHPEDARARARLGAAMLEIGDFGGAEIELAKARDLGAERKDIVVTECRLLAVRGSHEQVLKDCADTGEEAIDGDLAAARGDALLGLERVAQAQASFETALRARPDSLDAIQGLAAATFAADGPAAARKVFDAAPQSVKERPRYWLALGSSEIRGGDFASAETAFAKAVELTAGQDESRDRLGALAGLTEAQLRQGRNAEAAATAEMLLKVAPKSPVAKALRAQALAASGDLATARTLLEEAVSADPENAQARMLLGLVNMQQGNLGQAEMHLAQVVSRDPENVRAQQLLATVRNQLQTPQATLDALKPALGQPTTDPALLTLASRLSLQSGNRNEALGYLAQASEAAAKATPEAQLDVATAYIAAGDLEKASQILASMPQGTGAAGLQRETLLAATLLRQGKVDEAVVRADALVKQSPDDPAARNIAGGIYAAAGKADRARAEWQRVVELKPDDVGARMNLARLDLAEGKPDAATAQLQQALAKDPKNLLATLGMAAIAQSRNDPKEVERWMKKAADDHPDSVEVRMTQVQYYLGTRDFARAKAAADDALRIDPNSAPAFNARGLAQLGAGDVAAGIASFRQAVEKAPKGGYQLNLARAYMLDRKPAEALSVLDEALKANPRQPMALALAMGIAVQSRDLERAAGYMERLRRIEPDAPMTLRLEGDLAVAQGRYKDALGLYEKAAANGGDSALAIARYRAGMLAGVAQPQKPLEDWLQRQPNDVAAITLLAERRQQMGDIAAAIALYERAVAAAPGNVMALNNLAGLYQLRKDPRALATAERALAAAPDNAAVKDTVGWLLVEKGEIDKGLPLLREAAKALPDLPEVQYHFGVALARKGEAAEARRILQGVVDSKAPAEVVTGAKRELARIGG
jgi:putative PEP-CTERM system TPR-repeat lipoprotein